MARTPLFGAAGVVRGTNDAATREPGEPFHAGMLGFRSVWFTWRAPTNGIATFHTGGSTFDTILAVYTGTDLTNLTSVASDDPRGGFGTSEVQFNARWGTDYHIAIDAVGWEQGTYVLNWDFEATSDKLPVLLQAPAYQTVRFGETATFSVMAEPTNVTYQWLFEGVPIPGLVSSNLVITNVLGTTSSNLVVTNVQPDNLGSYSVRVGQAPRCFETAPVALQIGPCPKVQLYNFLLPAFEACSGTKASPIGRRSAAGSPVLNTNPPTQGFVQVGLGASDSAGGDVSDARDESSACVASLSGWKWLALQPTNSGILEMDTSQSRILTALSVYRFDKEGAMSISPVACDLKSGQRGLRARLCLVVTQDWFYGIAVAGFTNPAGVVQVDYRLHPLTTNFLFGRRFTKKGTNRIEIKCCTANSPIVLERTDTLDPGQREWRGIATNDGPCDAFTYVERATNQPGRFYQGHFPNGAPGP